MTEGYDIAYKNNRTISFVTHLEFPKLLSFYGRRVENYLYTYYPNHSIHLFCFISICWLEFEVNKESTA
jgi:hypothetical protein